MAISKLKSSYAKHSVTSVFLRIEGELKRYLMRFFVRSEDIEDVIQETFLRAINSEKQQEIQSPKSFLFTIAKNLALDEIAKKSKLMTCYIADLEELEVIDSAPMLDERLSVEQQFAVFCQALEALPPQCQKVFVMAKVFGFSHLEISRRLNISISTVEKHQVKGLRRCQEYLQKDEVYHYDQEVEIK